MKRSSIACLVPALLVSAALLDGCSWFHRDRVDYYKGATETRPLEVPPDLDSPTSTKELVVPGTAGAGAAASTAATGSASAEPPSTVGNNADLHIADNVENTWNRVGLALEHANIGKIASRDESTRSYAFDFNGTVASDAAPKEHHWYSRVLHPFGGGKSSEASAREVNASLRISVAEDAGGARVNVAGNPGDSSATDAVQRVVQTLRERLM